MERKMHIDTINCVKKYVSEKDYEGLKEYITNREKQIKQKNNEDESSDYMVNLVKDLK